LPPAAKDTDSATDPAKPQRVAKLIARAGLCSRRAAETLIAEGRVAVDGAVLTTPAVTVDDPGRITVDGERLPRAGRARLFRYHKPRGLVTTNRDPQAAQRSSRPCRTPCRAW
jgi:16S rRNA uridine-516 pseudouridylate synthase and related pseudouridylate synthases